MLIFSFQSVKLKPGRLGSPARKQKTPAEPGHFILLAEEEGFEPPDPVKGLRFSRPVQ
jgi:hypothetical protein